MVEFWFTDTYQGVMLRNIDMLFWEFFVNLSAIIKKVMIISLVVSKFLLEQFQKE